MVIKLYSRCSYIYKQECIPVGCVPPACCPYFPACTAWGVYLVRGAGPRRGVYLVPGGGGVPDPGGVPAIFCSQVRQVPNKHPPKKQSLTRNRAPDEPPKILECRVPEIATTLTTGFFHFVGYFRCFSQ